MEFSKTIFRTLYVTLLILPSVIYATPPSEGTVYLYTPSPYPNPRVFDATLDAAGYSDVINWGFSDYHPYDSHELLSGEWGAAIYYNGILSEPKTMWLTNRFICPNWDPTNSNFVFDSWPEKWAWDNPNNPVEGYDTGRSVITNNEVEITIDYEIADGGIFKYVLSGNHFGMYSIRQNQGDLRISLADGSVIRPPRGRKPKTEEEPQK